MSRPPPRPCRRPAFTLTGLVQHMAEVERNWFRRVLAGEQAPPIYDPQADPDGPDGGFELAEGATLARRPRHLARGDRLRPRALRRPCPGRHRPLHGSGRQPPLDLRPHDRGVRPPQRPCRSGPGNVSTALPAYRAAPQGLKAGLPCWSQAIIVAFAAATDLHRARAFYEQVLGLVRRCAQRHRVRARRQRHHAPRHRGP